MSKPTTATVWSTLGDDLRRFIRRRVANADVADDLLQETFLRIHRNIGTLRDADRVVPWVYRIARNLINDHHRNSSSGLALPIVEEPRDLHQENQETLRGRAAAWLEELIQRLPEKYQEPLRLSELDELKQQEVADRLGLSLSGAKSRIQRGRQFLRDELDKCCTFAFDGKGNLMDCTPKATRNVCLDCEDEL